MSNQINQIAHRIAHWARSGSFPVEKTAGYCMSGSWDNYYQRLLFPNKMLRVDVLDALVRKLRQLGYYASLAISPIENDKGLHMHMQLRRVRANLTTSELYLSETDKIRAAFKDDKTLPTRGDMEYWAREPDIIPTELRVFDLVFPNAILKGLSEGGGADKVTDDHIGMLTWTGEKWETKWLLAGKDGWGRSGPDHCSARARLVRRPAA